MGLRQLGEGAVECAAEAGNYLAANCGDGADNTFDELPPEVTMNHEAVAALPVSGNADKDLIRAMATRRIPYPLASDEDAADFPAADPASGIKPLYLIQNGVLYQRDDSDTTTSAGATCLVTSDGIRYKSDAVGIPFSVLDKDLTAQPDDPAEGDRYLIPTAATGADWAGKDGKIGEYTPRGWLFSTVPIGRWVYVEDEDALYYRNASGVWTSGPGSLVYSASTIPITAIIGAKASFIVKVENQTTNSPPSSPVAPVAYVIGPSPTGAWSGHAGDLAVCLVDGSFTIIEPESGDRVYDKSLGIQVEWNGTTWRGPTTIVDFATTGVQSGNNGSLAGSSLYTYSNSTPPTTANVRTSDLTLLFASKKSGAVLNFEYRAGLSSTNSVGTAAGNNRPIVAALFRGNASGTLETNAIDWMQLDGVPPAGPFVVPFNVVTPDTDMHTYAVGLLAYKVDSNVRQAIVDRRCFSVWELG